MPTLRTISFALVLPIPWMYCSATTTRLLVGMLTPAIRATRGLSWKPCTESANDASGPAPIRAGDPEPSSALVAEAHRYRNHAPSVNAARPRTRGKLGTRTTYGARAA